MAKGKFKIIGITVSISFLAFILLAIFIKAIGIIYNDWFVKYANLIAIISGAGVLLLVIMGAITFGSLTAKGKGFLG